MSCALTTELNLNKKITLLSYFELFLHCYCQMPTELFISNGKIKLFLQIAIQKKKISK